MTKISHVSEIISKVHPYIDEMEAALYGVSIRRRALGLPITVDYITWLKGRLLELEDEEI